MGQADYTEAICSAPNRRQMLKCLLGGALTASQPAFSSLAAGPSAANQGFGLPAVQKLAEELASRPFQASEPLPTELRSLSYDQYRLIAFRHERALWRKPPLPFWLELHHRGFVHVDKVDISFVEKGRTRAFPFASELFQYRGELRSLRTSDDWGYAGFRFLGRLPTRPHYQEFCSFQGASYFRAICTDQVYGLSARGLAINVGLPKPEEFPRFRAFWIERPASDARSTHVWALLDGPSVTGAYEFVITPGLRQTTLDVVCRLHFRQSVEKLGIAPMSSMFMWGQGGQPASDHRPQVHDSDGLLIASGDGEWLWRPLARHGQVSVSSFQFGGLKGFGLMQRDRDPEHYRDNEAKYHLRPSLWIQPAEPWGPGAVELLELPSDSEIHDNIAAYWVPKKPVGAGDTLSLKYRLFFATPDPAENRGGRFTQMALQRPSPREVQFVLEADSDALRSLAEAAEVRPVITASAGRIADPICSKLPGGTWQLRFKLARDDDKPSELRAFLRRGDEVLSETWSYLCM